MTNRLCRIETVYLNPMDKKSRGQRVGVHETRIPFRVENLVLNQSPIAHPRKDDIIELEAKSEAPTTIRKTHAPHAASIDPQS